MRLFVFLYILWLFSSLSQGTKQMNLKQMALASDTIELPPPPVFEGDTLYFLVDRNSPEVKYEEFYLNTPYNFNLIHVWTLNVSVLLFDKIQNKEFFFNLQTANKTFLAILSYRA